VQAGRHPLADLAATSLERGNSTDLGDNINGVGQQKAGEGAARHAGNYAGAGRSA